MKKFNIKVVVDKYIQETDLEQNLIPGQLVSITEEQVKRFPSTGTEYIEQKAKGKLIVYNAYSSKSQTLIPNTRFESEFTKIFRISKKIVVPGMIGSVPGEIEVEVIANEVGEEYNIGPSKFQLPGFREGGSPRYGAIYAISESQMQGGLKQEVSIITQDDLLNSKKLFEQEVKQNAVLKLKNKIAKVDGLTFLEQGVLDTDFKILSSAESGEQAEAFNLTSYSELQTLAFMQKELDDLIEENIILNISENQKLSDKQAKIIFSEIDQELSYGKLSFEIEVEKLIEWKIDKQAIEREINKKNLDQISEYLEYLPNIHKSQIEIWPSFLKHLPSALQKIKIVIETLNN